MELHEIQSVDAQSPTAIMDVLTHRVGCVRARVVLTPNFCGNKHFFLPASKKFGDQRFGSPRAVNVCGIEKRNTMVDCRFQNGQCLVVADVPPVCAQLPAAKTNFRDGSPSIDEVSCFHSCCCKRWDLGNEVNGIDLKAIDLLGSFSMFVDGNPQFIQRPWEHRFRDGTFDCKPLLRRGLSH